MFYSTVSKQLVAAVLNCSIRTCLVLMFVACAGFGFGQSVDSPEYHNAKANGTLPSEDLSLPFSGSQEQLDFMATPLSSSASSFSSSNPDCFIPIEDDWSELAANDDGSTSLISLPFTFSMYGQDYTAVYVNNNGNITFDSPFSTYSASGFPISTPMVAPFWGDVDTRIVTGEDNGQVRYKVNDHSLVVTWDAVASYSASSGYADDQRNTFQVIITDGTDGTLAAGNNIGFRYGIMDWTTGLASNGVDGFGGFPANVGVNAGNGADFFQVGLFDQEGTAYDGAFGNNDGVDYLENACFEFNVTDGMNFPPAVQLAPASVLNYCDGEMTADFQFIGPENDQSVTITFNSPDGLGFEVVNNESGAVAAASVSFAPTANGTFTFEAIATDDFESPASTVVSIEVIVDGCADDCTPSMEITCPENVEVNCADDLSPESIGLVIVETSECTAEVSVSYEDVQVSEDGDCPIQINRTFLVEAGDLAELCTQMITLIDTEGPEFVDFEETITVQCLEDVPAPGVYDAVDACSGLSFESEVFESNTGELDEACDLATAFGPGADWSLWLPILGQQGYVTNGNFVFDANGGSFEQYADGTARLFGTVVNENNENEIFELDLWFDNKSDWATWSSMGRSYKDDLNCATPDALYEDWTYYTLADGFSTATGAGDLAGSVLYFYHMPADYFFGFQIGEGANNKNCNYGFSGWFTYEGFVDGVAVDGHGDVNVDAECEPNNEQDCVHNTEFTYLYRAVDSCGNATVAEQTIVVNDTTGPEFVGFPEDMTIECDESYEMPVIEAVDNCTGDVEIEGPFMTETPGECENEVVIEYAWSAFDICDNQTNMVWTITVVDTTAPELTIPADVTVECDAVPAAGEATATDNCDEDVQIDFSEEMVPGECAGDYTLLRTWTANDNCGNSTSLTQTVTVIDTTAPVFDAYEASVEMPCDDINYDVALSATDNCGTVEVAYEDEASDAGCAGSIIRTYTATDDCGNAASAVVTITLIDAVAPSIDTFPADATVECDAVPAAQGDAVSGSDNCTEITISYDGEVITEGACAGDYSIARTWTITDACGNASSQTQTITVIDTTAPEFTFVPQDNEYSCEEEIPAINAEAEDNCGTVEVTFADEMLMGECPQSYTLVRTFTATDDCGNAATAVQNIYVYDNTAPEFTEVAADVTVECDQELPAPFAAATDNCDEDVTIDVSAEIIDGECPQEYTMIRTYTATDDCGNSATAQQVLNVVDTTAPEFVDYAYYTSVPCEEIEDYTLEATDNCGAVTVEIIEETLLSGGCIGVLIRTYQATDECGNMTEVEQYITITDTTAPEILNVPADATVECDEVGADDGTLFGSGDVTAEDNCEGEVELTYAEEVVPGECEDSYTVIRTWIAIDYCENETMAQSTVTVQDTTDPVFVEVPADITVECDEEIPAVEMPIAEDNCDGEVDVEVTEETEAGDCPQEYTLMRIFRGFDNCGNETMYVQNIYVVDTTAPVFTSVPADATYECDEEIAVMDATAEDNCGDVTVTYADGEIMAGECPEAYSFIRTFTAVDECGNSATAEQLISVEDTTAPVMEGEAFIEMPCDMISDALFVTASDNCDAEVEITYNDDVVSGGCAGNVIRTYTATDNCGNSSEFTQVINLIDEVAPEFSAFPADLTVECDNVPAVSDMVDAEDNCTEVSIEYNGEEFIAGDCMGNYTLVRTWTATDNCGNATVQSQTITVVDTTAPEFTSVPADATYECDEEIPAFNAEAEDNCGTVEVTFEDVVADGECANASIITRTFTATDDCGNSATAVQTINVVDTTAPIFDFVPADVSVECSDELPADQATASDNCGDVTITSEDVISTGGSGGPGATSFDGCTADFRTELALENIVPGARVFEALGVTIGEGAELGMDDEIANPNGFVGAVEVDLTGSTLNVTVVETFGDWADFESVTVMISNISCGGISNVEVELDELLDEELSAAFDLIVEYTADSITITWTNTAPTDIIYIDQDASSIFNINGSIACIPDNVITRTWTAVDACGNESSATQVITLVDTTAPVIEGEAQLEMPCDDIDDAILVTATDNCSDVEITFEDLQVSGGCAGVILRNYIATDACGNASEFTQVINLIDEVAPELAGVPADATVECGDEIPAPADVTATDNCDDSLEVLFTEVTEDNGCLYNIIRTWSVTDHCDNTTTASQTITIVDTTAPALEVAADVTIECDQEVPAAAWEASDICDEDLSEVVTEVTVDGDCPNNYTIERTYTVTDACGNTTSMMQTITVVDTTAPEFTSVPEGDTFECDEDIDYGMAAASDNCGDVTITVADEMIAGDCENAYSIVRTWTATDACGNAAEATTTYNVEDTTAPVITAEAQIEMPCDDIDMAIFATAEDNCDAEVEITYADLEVSGGCAGVILRTYTATDNCGNSSEYTQVINLIDEVAPELEGVPADLTIECGEEVPAAAEVSAADNCDDDLEVLYSEEIVENDCLYSIVRTWSVVDHCDNMASASQTITIVDTTAPALEVAADVTIECDQEVPAAAWEASDICDEDLSEVVTEVTVDGDCPNNYTIERTYTVTDACGNTTSMMQTITVEDTTAPEFTFVPAGNEFECDETVEYGDATAADNCGDVTITFADMIEAGQCANEYTIIRTWTATDACGNAAEAQSFYYIYDATAPSFDGSVEDVNVECADEVPAMPELTATDNCGDATVSMSSEVLEQDECGNGVTVVTYIATDACGNTAELSYTITVNDVTAPELSDMPEDLVIDCEAEVPAPAEISAMDNCNEVEVIFTEEILGNEPAEGSIADCVGYTGESPFYATDWSLWLQAFPGNDDYYTTTNVNFVEYPDGTATISGNVISTSTAGGWTIDVTLENGLDWEGWTSQDFPTSYKDDFNVAGQNYLDWTYYVVQAGNATLTGTGIYEGDVLELSHAPANYYYAFQVGVAANNTTSNYGGGGWFYYDGTVGGMDVSGAGDFAFDLDCCPQYEILRTWTATDCSGNSVSHSQIISFSDLGEEAVAEDETGDNWSDVAVERENKAQHTIFPNPTNAKSMIQFANDVDGHTVIEVYSLNGTKVADVFNQETAAGHNYRADIDAQDLADGIYLVRIQHNGQVTTDRLIISK